jgi:DNA-directed RNA polymerase I, II, and III subunit RPABC2
MSNDLDFDSNENIVNDSQLNDENDNDSKLNTMPIDEEDEDNFEESKIVNYSNILDATSQMKKKRTNPYLTKYEKARIIGIRAQQIASGSIPLVESKGLVSPISIALKELKERKIPFIIRRKLPNNTYEDWTIEELKF